MRGLSELPAAIFVIDPHREHIAVVEAKPTYATPGDGLDAEKGPTRNTGAVPRNVEAVLRRYARTAIEPEIRQAAKLAARLLRASLDARKAQLAQEQGFLWDDLEEVA